MALTAGTRIRLYEVEVRELISAERGWLAVPTTPCSACGSTVLRSTSKRLG